MRTLASANQADTGKIRALGDLARLHRLRDRGLELCLFVALYLGLERASQLHSFEFLDIALWNPSAAASLILLLTRGLAYAPAVFAAGLLSSLVVHHTPHSLASILLWNAMLAASCAALAFALRRAGFQLGRGAMQDTVSLLVLAPVGALLTATLACGAMALTGDLPPDRFWTAVTHFWVGDALGILVVIPAVTAVLILRRGELDFQRHAIAADVMVFAAGLGVAVWFMFGRLNTDDRQFFYFLFLPVIWAAIRAGFPGASIAVVVSQLALLTVTEAVGYSSNAVIGLQMLMLALAATGHLLGASVSERRQSEARAKIQQAELARMARNTTAGAMGVALAHQISQPLSTVATHIHVALRQAKSGQKPGEGGCDEIVQSLQVATDEMRRAQDVLGRLREFISHGKAEMTRVDLPALIVRLTDILRAEAGRKEVRFSFDLAPVPAVRADALQIEQVILNLVSNAVDAAFERQDGRGRVLVRTVAEGGAARLVVEDNGSGISHEIIERLYEPFATTKETGMGLGLALSRQIVALHGGRMWWEAAQPHGTRFVVELRAAQGDMA